MVKNRKTLSVIIFSLVALLLIGIAIFFLYPKDAEDYTGRQTSIVTTKIDASSTKGKITIEIFFNETEGNYRIYYADASGKSLDGYEAIKEVKINSQNTKIILENLILPYKCKGLFIVGEKTSSFVLLPQAYLQEDEYKYRFGAISDIHFNNGDYLTPALDFLDMQEIDFVAASGDLTNSGELEYLNKFNDVIGDREYKVYTTSGNHDHVAVKNGDWQKTINTSIKTDKEVVTIAPNGLDFVFSPKKAENIVFIFLCQTDWYYPKEPNKNEYTIVKKEQLSWLSSQLEAYKEKTVCLFFHTFLSSPNGTQDSAAGNILSPGGYSYNLPYSYGTADEIEFRALLKQYKNVVFFSGHSHWMYEMEKYNENLNLSNFDGEYCYMVHISSISAPRWIDDDDTERTDKIGEESEGLIVELYNDYMLIIPVDFKTQEFQSEYIKMIPIK